MRNTRSNSFHMASGGFTLVELLVVIGIIAVLLAILMPALNRAREMSNRTKCLSNLRQLGMAMTMYTDEYKGRLPNANPWPQSVNDYNASNYVLVQLYKGWVKNPGTFHCPSDADPTPGDIVTADPSLPNSARVSYDFYSVFWYPELGPKIHRIKDAPLAWDLDGGSRKQEPDQNHGVGGGNVVYADCHADWQPNTDWDGPSWPSPAAKYYNR